MMADVWRKRYNLKVDMYLDPADHLVNRLWREFRDNTPTLIEFEKIRSVYHGTIPKKERKVEIAKNTCLTVDAEETAVCQGVVEYYFALRILAYASAKAGNYEADSFVEQGGSKVNFAPLDVNLNYADRALMQALDRQLRPHEALAWLREKDLHTRALMISKMRSGYPQGEALTLAVAESKVEWTTGRRVPRGRSRSYDRDDRRRDRGGKADKGKGKGAGGKNPDKYDKHRDDRNEGSRKGDGGTKRKYAQFMSGHRKLCIEYNKGKCSRDEDKCPKREWHRCSVITEGGKFPCGERHASVDRRDGR